MEDDDDNKDGLDKAKKKENSQKKKYNIKDKEFNEKKLQNQNK